FVLKLYEYCERRLNMLRYNIPFREVRIMSQYIAYPKKGRMFLLGIGAILFILIGLVFLFITFDGEVNWAYRMIGLICILFFGMCFVFIVKQLFSKKPALLIDEKGITDWSSAIQVGLIEWEEIEDTRLIVYSGQKFLAIYTYDKELIINRTHGFRKIAYKMNKALIDSQVNIAYKN